MDMKHFPWGLFISLVFSFWAGFIILLFLGSCQKESPRSLVAPKSFSQVQDSLKALGYVGVINQYAKESNLDPYFVDAVINAESNYNWRATSSSGAKGLMQLMDCTVEDYEDQPETLNLYDARTNIRIGCRHLSYLMGRYSGDLRKVVMAYNSGVGSMRKHKNNPPFPETQDYWKKVKFLYIPPTSVGPKVDGLWHSPMAER